MSEERKIETNSELKSGDQLTVSSQQSAIGNEQLPPSDNRELETASQPLTDSKTQPPSMETHAHHLHKAPGKKWTHYLFEFLMLFLAVFCGFLAENFREHVVEKERAIQYIKSLYEDLKTDTARISFNINFDDEKLSGLGNLGDCYNTVSKNINETSCLLPLIKNSVINRPFKITDRTVNQLANAGGFRLLQKEDADSIIAYLNEFNIFQDFQTTRFQDAQNNVRSTFNLLVNFNANDQMYPSNGKQLINGSFNDQDITEPILFSGDKVLLNKYFNELKLYYRVAINHKVYLLNLRNNQIRMIQYFKSKYHFE